MKGLSKAWAWFLEALTRRRARAEHRLLVIALEQLLYGWLLSPRQRSVLAAIVEKWAEKAGVDEALQNLQREVERQAIKHAVMDRVVKACLRDKASSG